MHFYVIFVRGDVEPEVFGPYDSVSKRDQVAFALRRKHGLGHGIFKAEVCNGSLSVNAYSGSFFEREG